VPNYKRRTIIDKARALSQPSPKVKGSYSIGKTNFFSTARAEAKKVYTPQTYEATSYEAVVLSVESTPTKNSFFGSLLSTSTEVEVVVRARVPGIHDHLPDPFKTANPEAIVRLYPTFSGKLDKTPTIGSIATVSFYNSNNKNAQYGNGKILGLVQSQVNNSGESSNTKPGGASESSLGSYACQFLSFLVNPPSQGAPDIPNKPTRPSAENPQTINSSWSGESSPINRTGSPTIKPTGSLSPTEITESTLTDLMKSFPASCQKRYNLGEFSGEESTATPPNNNPQDDNSELPRWPVTIPQPPNNRGLGMITSFMQKGRKLRVTYRDEQTGKSETRDQYKNHNGIDIGVPVGTEVLAVMDGTVVKASPPAEGSAGYLVIIRHDGVGGEGSNAMHSCYFHLTSVSVKTKHPDGTPVKVKRGASLGFTGGAEGAVGSGASTGPHLHFEIRRSRFGSRTNLARYVNPVRFFKTPMKKVASLRAGL
jgi:murein DD-endopeptidase MepM/ murein hydrolase activator NlpD